MGADLEPKLASISERLGASAGTVLPLFIYIVAWSFCLGLGRIPLQPMLELLAAYVLPVVCVVLDGATKRATHGMRMMHICIRSANGAPIGFWHCAARILLGIVLLPLIPVSAIIAAVDARHRTLADLLCGTGVWLDVKLPDPDVSRGFEVLPLEDRQHL